MFEETLEMVVERMRRYRFLYEQNEMAVREQIVNPILRSLGWNPENPEEVQPNISTEEGVPDYSLIKNGNRVLFIEAKKLSVDIEQRKAIRQLAKYCFGEGMKYGVLTNGAIWILFRAFQEDTTIDERTIWKTDLEKDDPTAIFRRLSTISKPSIETIETLIEKSRILDEIWQSLMDEPREIIRGLVPVFDRLIKQNYPDYEFEPPEIENFLKERITELVTPTEDLEIAPPPEPRVGEQPLPSKPSKIKIGNDIREISHANEILINTAEWLIKEGKLQKRDCPIQIGHTWYLVNVEPKHSDGKEFYNPKRLSNGLYMEVNFSKPNCIKNAKWLLERFGYRGDMLEVK